MNEDISHSAIVMYRNMMHSAWSEKTNPTGDVSEGRQSGASYSIYKPATPNSTYNNMPQNLSIKVMVLSFGTN